MCLLTEARVWLNHSDFWEARGDLIFRCEFSFSRWTHRLVVFLAVFYLISTAVRAQESSKIGYDGSVVGISFFEKNPQVSSRDPFSKGNVELELLGGHSDLADTGLPNACVHTDIQNTPHRSRSSSLSLTIYSFENKFQV